MNIVYLLFYTLKNLTLLKSLIENLFSRHRLLMVVANQSFNGLLPNFAVPKRGAIDQISIKKK